MPTSCPHPTAAEGDTKGMKTERPALQTLGLSLIPTCPPTNTQQITAAFPDARENGQCQRVKPSVCFMPVARQRPNCVLRLD